MHPRHVSHDSTADHDVVEMRDDKVGVGNVHINSQRCQKQASKTADGEQPNKPQRIQHGSIKGN